MVEMVYISWKMNGATPMYWSIMAPKTKPPFGSCAIYFCYGVFFLSSKFFDFIWQTAKEFSNRFMKDERRIMMEGIANSVEHPQKQFLNKRIIIPYEKQLLNI